jgi:hypothetical protein
MKRGWRIFLWIAGIIIAAAIILPLLNQVIPVAIISTPLEVTFRVTDPDNNVLPGSPARLVFLCDKTWAEANTGYQVTTDAKGEAHFTAPVKLDRHFRFMPTNFIASLISPPQLTSHLAVGAEMDYMGKKALYVVEMVQFDDGTTMQDDFYVMLRDKDGRYTQRIDNVPPDGWRVRKLIGFGDLVGGIGYESSDFGLEAPGEKGKPWTLKLAFKKYPPPVQP